MRKSIKVDGETVSMSSAETNQRLLSMAYNKGQPDESFFAHELAAVAPTLFYDDGTMRKTVKSQLINLIVQIDPATVVTSDIGIGARIYDGCAVFYWFPWPKIGTLETVC